MEVFPGWTVGKSLCRPFFRSISVYRSIVPPTMFHPRVVANSVVVVPSEGLVQIFGNGKLLDVLLSEKSYCSSRMALFDGRDDAAAAGSVWFDRSCEVRGTLTSREGAFGGIRYSYLLCLPFYKREEFQDDLHEGLRRGEFIYSDSRTFG